MLISMTGFTQLSKTLVVENQNIPLVITAKSLNARFFEPLLRMPSALGNLETIIIKESKRVLVRGSFTLTINIDSSIFKNKTLLFVPSVVETYLQAAKTLKKNYHIADDLSCNALLSLPYVFEPAESILDEKISEAILKEVFKAIGNLKKERLNEGKALEKDLRANSKKLAAHIKFVEKRAEEILDTKKQIYTELLSAHEAKTSESPSDIALATMQFHIDRMEINEEIVRFNTHLALLESVLKQSKEEEKGKKIDFILQELSREINTISAKSSDAVMGTLAVEIKTLIEKCREQTHNIV